MTTANFLLALHYCCIIVIDMCIFCNIMTVPLSIIQKHQSSKSIIGREFLRAVQDSSRAAERQNLLRAVQDWNQNCREVPIVFERIPGAVRCLVVAIRCHAMLLCVLLLCVLLCVVVVVVCCCVCCCCCCCVLLLCVLLLCMWLLCVLFYW
jgi:hypothetical protein